VKLMVKEKIISLVIREGRYLEEMQEGHMQTVRNAVRTREELGPSDAENLEKVLNDWDEHDDRVTDFYARWIGKRFPKMIDCVEKLNAIPTRSQAPRVSEAIHDRSI